MDESIKFMLLVHNSDLEALFPFFGTSMNASPKVKRSHTKLGVAWPGHLFVKVAFHIQSESILQTLFPLTILKISCSLM